MSGLRSWPYNLTNQKQRSSTFWLLRVWKRKKEMTLLVCHTWPTKTKVKHILTSSCLKRKKKQTTLLKDETLDQPKQGQAHFGFFMFWKRKERKKLERKRLYWKMTHEMHGKYKLWRIRRRRRRRWWWWWRSRRHDMETKQNQNFASNKTKTNLEWVKRKRRLLTICNKWQTAKAKAKTKYVAS